MHNGSATIIHSNGLASWNLQISRAEKAFNAFSDEEFYLPVAPSKNRVIYLYGHLAAYHDALKETLGIGKRTNPELAVIFLQNPDDQQSKLISLEAVKAYWKNIHSELNELFVNLPAAEWFKRHNSVTDEDFKKDPARIN